MMRESALIVPKRINKWREIFVISIKNVITLCPWCENVCHLLEIHFKISIKM